MKPVFGVDITTDRRNDWSNSDEFILRKVGAELEAKLEGAADSAHTIEKKSGLSLLETILRAVSGTAALFVFIGVFDHALDHGFKEALKKLWPWFCVFAICGAAWLALTLIGRLKKRKMLVSGEAAAANEALEAALDKARSELGVPENAEAVDVFLLSYKLKNGKLKIDGDPFWLNGEVYAYRDGDALMLWGGEKVWAFPIKNMKGIKTVRAFKTAMCWNKKEKHKEGRFAQYRLIPNNYGLRMKAYHILELEHGGESYGIYFPCWELPVFERLTGLAAEEASKE
ncbi:MAG: hypothetical protein IKI64_05885 [Clostridia bacterium]|nr:hypothetical protein [Clostridia bacterium]